MSKSRWWLLLGGPPILVGAIYLLAMPTSGPGAITAAAPLVHVSTTSNPGDLQQQCRRVADELTGELPSGSSLVIQAPFVLAGDLPVSRLQQIARDTIDPVTAALRQSYFRQPPRRPITVLLWSSHDSYRRYTSRQAGAFYASYYGFYLKPQRRVVVSLATGSGTLAHELTHALADADCPNLPEWFDEGLAALHEEAVFSDDGGRLIGLSNWRTVQLRSELRGGNLRPLAALLRDGRVRPGFESVDYAHARCLCLFLQQRGILAEFYRTLVDQIETDPRGGRALAAVIHPQTPAELEIEFRRWLTTHGGPDRPFGLFANP